MNLETLARTCCTLGDDKEYGLLYDTKTKQIIWEKKGKEEEMYIPKKYAGREDCILMHNHPPEIIDSIICNIPLTPNDVYTAIGYNQKAVYATDGVYIYGIERPKNGWETIKGMHEFYRPFWRQFNAIQNEMKRDVKNMKLSPVDYYTTATIKQYKKTFKDALGFDMKVIPMKHPCYFSKLDFWFIVPQTAPKWMKTSPKLMALLEKKWEYAQKKLGL